MCQAIDQISFEAIDCVPQLRTSPFASQDIKQWMKFESMTVYKITTANITKEELPYCSDLWLIVKCW